MLSILVGFVLIAFFGASFAFWTGRNSDHDRRRNLLRQAQIAAASIDPAMVLRLTASTADTATPEYRAICEELRRIRSASSDIRFVYLLTQRNGRVVFLAESEPEDSTDHSPPGMVYEDATDELKAACTSGQSFTEGPLNDQYGVWVSAFASMRGPGTGEIIAVLGMDCDARNWHKWIIRSLMEPLLITLLAAVLWGVLVIWLRSIQLSADRIAASDRSLRVSEERLRSALFGARQSLWDLNLSDGKLYFDSQWSFLIGCASSETPGHIDVWRGMIHPEDLQGLLKVIHEALESPETSHFEAEYRVRAKSGDWIWILDRALIVRRDVDGEPVRMTGTIQNITSRKQTEHILHERADQMERLNRMMNTREGRIVELKEEVNNLLGKLGHPARYGKEKLMPEPVIDHGSPIPEQSLQKNMVSVMEDLETTNHRLQKEIAEHRESVDKLRELSQAVEQSPASVIITDPEGVILYVNPTFTEASGYSAFDVIGRTPAVLKSGRQTTEFYRILWETIRAGKTWRGEFENRRKDGTAFWELAVISPILDYQGRIVRFLALKQDITEKRKADEQMRRTVAEMEQMNRLMTGREERVLELKTEVNELCLALGRPYAYRVQQQRADVNDSELEPSSTPEQEETHS